MNALLHTRQFILSVIVCFLFIVGRTDATNEGHRFSKIRAEYDKLRDYLLAEKSWDDVSNGNISEAFGRLWPLVCDWTVAYLEERPYATADDVTRKVAELEPINATVVQLVEGNHATYVVSANFISDRFSISGTFFIVRRTGARSFHVAWNIKDVAAQHYASRDEIGYWAYAGFAPYGDGPLIGYVSGLPPSNTGVLRFYIDATAAVLAGGTYPKQISIWEWNGNEAIPLLIQTYRSTGYTGDVEFDGEFLKIPTKEEYKTVISCGPCPGATVMWTIRVTPTGIEDLGRKHVNQEMKLVDELWDQIVHGKNAENIASPQVVETVRQIIEEIGLSADDSLGLGQGGGGVVSISNGTRIFCFKADELGCAHVFFEIDTRNSHLYISNVRVVEDCQHNCDEVWNRIQKTEETPRGAKSL